jgi:hypothetical protein
MRTAILTLRLSLFAVSAEPTHLQIWNQMTRRRRKMVSPLGILAPYFHDIAEHWVLKAIGAVGCEDNVIDCSDYDSYSDSIVDADMTSLIDEPLTDAEFFEEPKSKTRAVITSKRASVMPKQGGASNQDVITGEVEDDMTTKRKRSESLTKSKQV